MALSLLLVLAGGVIFADDATPFNDVIPAKLKVSYAHDMGDVCEIELRNGDINYRLKKIRGDSDTGSLHLTYDQWSKFIAALNAIKVYKWESHYNGPVLPLDAGFYWSFEIELGERHFVSEGGSSYPLDGDINPAFRKGPHAAFGLFIQAVSSLIGRDFL